MLQTVVIGVLCISISAFAQTAGAAPASTAAPSSQIALGSSAALVDVQLTGTATWTMGGDKETGTVVLKARRDGRSRMDVQFEGKRLVEVRVNDPREPHVYLYDGSAWKESAVHNSWNDANWFFPAFTTAAIPIERGVAVTDTSQTSIRTQFVIAGQKPDMAKLIQLLSVTDFQIDSSTHQIVSIRWLAHSANDVYVSIPYEVQLSDYRDVSGTKVPYRIQRYFNGELQLDVTILSVALNPGLPAGDFAPVLN